MAAKRALSDYNITIGTMKQGSRNNIADVPSVRVGHCKGDTARHKTGVTVVLPTALGDDVWEQKCAAASVAFNKFGKSCGLVRMDTARHLIAISFMIKMVSMCSYFRTLL